VKCVNFYTIGLLYLMPFFTSAVVINFDDEVINSYASPGQDGVGSYITEDDGSTITLTGNIWRSIDFNYDVTTQTVLSFDFMSSVEGEIQAIGVDDDYQMKDSTLFQLFGTQLWGNQTFKNYNNLGEWVTYEILLNDYVQGSFNTLFFANDHDSSNTPISSSSFRNVVICEGCDRATVVSEPSALALLGFGLIGFFARTNSRK
jgi:hypothetical protein